MKKSDMTVIKRALCDIIARQSLMSYDRFVEVAGQMLHVSRTTPTASFLVDHPGFAEDLKHKAEDLREVMRAANTILGHYVSVRHMKMMRSITDTHTWLFFKWIVRNVKAVNKVKA